MPRSQKSDEKAPKKSRGKRSGSQPSKGYEFQTEVTFVNHGKVPKGTSFSREDVREHSFPSKKPDKAKKASAVKVFSKGIQFKEKVVYGGRTKKILEYDSIKLLEQLSSDCRMVFVNYENAKNGYFLVLGLLDANQVIRLMSLVKEDNPNAEIRWADTRASSSNEKSIQDDVLEPGKSDTTDPTTYHESERAYQRNSLPSLSNRSGSYRARPWTATSSYICADPHFDDGTVCSSKTLDAFTSQRDKPRRHSRRRSSYNSLDLSSDDGFHLSANGLKSQYYYVGPSDEEDSISKIVHHGKPRHKKSHQHKHRHYALGDEVSVSMTPSSIFSNVDYYSTDGFGTVKDSSVKGTPTRKSNTTRKSSYRPKSRQLPLSEAERNKGSWHSDVLFLTPTKNGGVKVSADGPVMLYTATRANVNRNDSSSSDEDSTSDGEGDFIYSSDSTLTLEGPVRDPLRLDLEANYTNGR
ncbi:hypothetical protein EGR_01609 [Echinococcus granulosus]|uniref:DUF5734 domain-containing protein n=1 Tax=Echinococcus granulosus TaxID=6210 RepID=W6UY44_ECHGR|nr:hypothetical protein EGR_01609 [Echinococcus granulosus]EUB63527.1 hypothetical protein EGR_01609 [Echinococcus granulosus]